MKRTILVLFTVFTILGSTALMSAPLAQDDLQLQRDRQLVRDVQQALLDKGYAVGAVDGIVGPQTREALRSFQADEGLRVTGRMTDETLRRLGVKRRAAGEGDPQRRGGVVGAVTSGATTAAKATAAGATTAGRATAKGATAAAKGTTTGAKAAAQGTTTGAKAAAKGTATGAEATAEGATTGAKAVAGGVESGAEATAKGAKSVARGTRNLLFGKDEDDKIKDRVAKAFKDDPAIDPSHFEIQVKDRIVTLRFKKGDSREWNRAVAVARRVEGVDRVFVRHN